jgi:aminoglycoside phosphotransferase (APT) family kinase protein
VLFLIDDAPILELALALVLVVGLFAWRILGSLIQAHAAECRQRELLARWRARHGAPGTSR